MITNVMAIGLMDEIITDNIRYLLIERHYRESNGMFMVDRIPIRYWTRSVNSYFMSMRKGTLVGVKGRIEMVEGVGLCIMCEFFETLNIPSEGSHSQTP
jgi:hypothetical protein